jgi:hypothetical protein
VTAADFEKVASKQNDQDFTPNILED